MEIKKVIICGLGALGLTYAAKLKNICELKILADKKRVVKYKQKPLLFNGETINLEYLTPDDSFQADLIIITTKASGLESAIKYIKNFVNEKTIIISLINGISSEEKIAKEYGWDKVLRSYFIGHSAIKKENNIIQDGIGKIVIEPNKIIEDFFRQNKLDYEISNNIIYSQWLKLGVNIVLNELSAIYKGNVGEIKKHKNFLNTAQNLLKEIKKIAKEVGIKNLENYEKEVLENIELVSDDGITSMYQDILAKRKTEIDIFAGEIIKLGKQYNILTPYNEDMYNKIKDLEKDF